MTLPKWQREHICSCPTDEEDCNYKKALAIAVEALQIEHKLMGRYFSKRLELALAQIEAMGQSK